MFEIRRTEAFANWLSALGDLRAKAKVLARISNMQEGNPGDCKAVGGGVFESRIDYGPGYRIYFIRRGTDLILLLAGGDKSTQSRDIGKARQLATRLE